MKRRKIKLGTATAEGLARGVDEFGSIRPKRSKGRGGTEETKA